jgi:NADPH:quinone reductase-like Zn-dependent oxidoreductase
MRAIVIQKFGGPESLVIKELPDPEPKPGHVVIQVKAFGINHAEMHMRRGGVGRSRRGQRHRVRRPRQILPWRRISGRDQGSRIDGRHGSDD